MHHYPLLKWPVRTTTAPHTRQQLIRREPGSGGDEGGEGSQLANVTDTVKHTPLHKSEFIVYADSSKEKLVRSQLSVLQEVEVIVDVNCREQYQLYRRYLHK